MSEVWRLTDQEIKAVELSGGDVPGAQRAKRQAYLNNGGVILNPDALEVMYQAVKEARDFINYMPCIGECTCGDKKSQLAKLDKALAKVKSK